MLKCSLMLHTQRVDLGTKFVSAEGVMAMALATVAIGTERFGTPKFNAGEFAEYAQSLRDIGVTHLNVGLPGESRAAFGENIALFGQDVMPLIEQL